METSPSNPTRKRFLQGLGAVVAGIFLFKPTTRNVQSNEQKAAAKDPLFRLAKADARSVNRSKLMS